MQELNGMLARARAATGESAVAARVAAALLARFARRFEQRAILRLLCVPDAVRRPLAEAGLASFFWQPESARRSAPDA